MPRKTVEIILAKCSKKKKTFGIRNEKREDGKWHQTWAFPVDEDKAKREGFESNVLSGEFVIEDDYACPHCGSTKWTQCGSCNKIYCDDTKIGDVSKCPWCGHSGRLVQGDTFDIKGGGF